MRTWLFRRPRRTPGRFESRDRGGRAAGDASKRAGRSDRLSSSRPDCPARQVSPADLVAILREPAPEDPDARRPARRRRASRRTSDGWRSRRDVAARAWLPATFRACSGSSRRMASAGCWGSGHPSLAVRRDCASRSWRYRRSSACPTGASPPASRSIPRAADSARRNRSSSSSSRAKMAFGASTIFARQRNRSAPPARPSETQMPHRARSCATRSRPVRVCRSALPGRRCRCAAPTSPAPASSSVPPAEEPAERWRAPTGWHSDAQPVVARGLVFFGGFSLGERTPLLEAVDAATGAVRWQTTAPVAWARDSRFAGAGWRHPLCPRAGARRRGHGGRRRDRRAALVRAVRIHLGHGASGRRRRGLCRRLGRPQRARPHPERRVWRPLRPRPAHRPRALALPGPGSVRPGLRWAGTPSMFPATAGSLPSTERPAASAGRRVSRRAPERRRPSPATPSSSPARRSPPARSGVFALDAASGALRWRVDFPRAPGARAGTAAANGLVFVSSVGRPAR